MHDDNQKLVEYAEKRLEEWALWSDAECTVGIGYHPCNILETYRLHGGIVVNTPNDFVPQIENKRAIEVEACIQQLHKNSRTQVAVLKQEYFRIGTVFQKAKRVNLSKHQYVEQLLLAKKWIGAYLFKNKRYI